MSLTRIQRGMLGTGSVLPDNLITTSTYTVAGLTATGIVTATTLNAVTGNITTVNATTAAVSGTATAGRVNAGTVAATTVTASASVSSPSLVASTSIIAPQGTFVNADSVNMSADLAVFTTATIGKLTVNTAITSLTATNFTVNGEVRVGNASGLLVKTLRSSTATTIAYYNSSTGELSYGSVASLIPSAYDQSLNTTNVVTFAGVTATSLTIAGVQQTSAWTGTVASSQITAVSTSKVTGLSTIGFTGKLSDGTGSISTSTVTGLSKVGYTNNYNDLSNKPALATVATSGSYNDLADKPTSWSTSSITGLSTVGYTNKYADLSNKPTDQNLFSTSTVTFKTILVEGGIFTLTQAQIVEGESVPGSISVAGNIYLYGDISRSAGNGPLIMNCDDGVVFDSGTELLFQGAAIRPYYATGTVPTSIGNSSHRFHNVWAENGNFTTTVYAGDLMPFNGGSSWSAAAGDIGDTNRRWENIWVKNINAQSTITGGSLLIDTLVFSGDSTVQTTAWTGTVAASSVSGLSTVATSGNYSDLSNKPTSWSTSSITGLSVVGYSNNYNDLSNLPSLPNQSLNTTNSPTFQNITLNGSQLALNGINNTSPGFYLTYDASTSKYVGYSAAPDQNLYTTSSVSFRQITSLGGIYATTGTQVQKTLTAGGFPLNSAGTASVFLSTGFSPAAIVSNYSGGTTGDLFIRAYGQNRPNGLSNTAPNPNIRIESAYGTQSAPTAMLANQNLGGLSSMGFDGANWPADTGQGHNFLGWFATENMTYTGTTTLQAGSGFSIFAQPSWTRPGVSTTRQRFLFATYTTATGGPSIMNLQFGSGLASDGAPTMTMVDGTTYTGHGRTQSQFINSNLFVVGVPSQDTAPDNATLTATNSITFVGGRRSGVSGRRNAIQSGDFVGVISWQGQTASSGTQFGSQTAYVNISALENFSGSARGSQFNLGTANTGTTTISSRLALRDQLHSYNAQSHAFNNAAGSSTLLSLSTNSNAVFGQGITVGGTGVTYPGDGQIQNLAWQPGYGSFYDTTANQTAANITNLNVVSIGSVSTNTSDVTLLSNGMKVSVAGVYNIQLSLQFENSSSGADDVVVWLRQNSTDLTNSSGVVTVPGQHGGVNGKTIAAWNYLLPASANDTFYLMWQPQNTGVFIATQAVGTGVPSAPGVIATIVRER